MRRRGSALALTAVASVVFALGALTAGATRLLASVDVSWLTWFGGWLNSAGFGGAAAIVAASIAFGAARASSRRQERADRKSQWWARAEWALDATLHPSATVKRVGYDMLTALGTSEWAGEHESDVIAAATRRPLDASIAANSGWGTVWGAGHRSDRRG